MYSKINQWDRLSKDFSQIEEDEEIIILLGRRSYVVRVAKEKDFENHGLKDKAND